MAEHNIYAKEALSKDCVTITFAGDILFDPNYSVMATLLQNGGNLESSIASMKLDFVFLALFFFIFSVYHKM